MSESMVEDFSAVAGAGGGSAQVSVDDREHAYIRRQRWRLKQGDTTAAANIGAAYRILGRYRLAFHWWCKGAEHGDGDAFVDIGYCYQHGLGVRRNKRASEQAYRAAMATESTTEGSREEAMYHLAVLLRSGPKVSEEVVKLLIQASQDGDYPQAAQLLKSGRERSVDVPFVCRRELRKKIATVACPLHRRS
jgi:TPR repeat protein